MAAKEIAGGTVLRGAKGELYFIRDEVLPAFKIEGEGARRIKRLLDQGAGPLQVKAPADAPLRYVSGDLLRDQPTDMAVPDLLLKPGAVKSTVMCPWFC
jgi:hypothetical protein